MFRRSDLGVEADMAGAVELKEVGPGFVEIDAADLFGAVGEDDNILWHCKPDPKRVRQYLCYIIDRIDRNVTWLTPKGRGYLPSTKLTPILSARITRSTYTESTVKRSWEEPPGERSAAATRSPKITIAKARSSWRDTQQSPSA